MLPDNRVVLKHMIGSTAGLVRLLKVHDGHSQNGKTGRVGEHRVAKNAGLGCNEVSQALFPQRQAMSHIV